MRHLVLLLAILLCGCGKSGGGFPAIPPSATTPPPTESSNPDTSAPVVARLSVTAPDRFTGGTTTVSLAAEDDQRLASVSLRITQPDGSTIEVTPTAAGGTTYAASFEARANTRQDGQPEVYALVIAARDAAGNEATATAQVSIPAPMMPPGTPEFSP